MQTIVKQALKSGRSLVLAPLIVFSLFLIFCGTREFVAGVLLIPGNPGLAKLQGRSDADAAILSTVVSAEHNVLSIREQASVWSNLGLALGAQAQQSSPEERQAKLDEARQATLRSLAMAPANPYAWTRLAVLDLALGADRRTIATHWRMAVMTGPIENWLYLARIKVSAAIWPELTNEDRAKVFAEIRYLWTYQSPAVLQMADDAFTANVIRAALVVDLPQLFNFERQLKSRTKQ